MVRHARFDVKAARVKELKAHRDRTLEVEPAELKAAKRLRFSTVVDDLRRCNVFIVTVPTPIDKYKRPDLSPVESASRTVGSALKKGDVVIFESTVYPGCTEEVAVPIMEAASGLKYNRDFFCGYSPERINPGDKEHRLPTIRKITSGSTPVVADFVDDLYATIITAGTYKASSLAVAEAAKVIENTQRDVNIALINETGAGAEVHGIVADDKPRCWQRTQAVSEGSGAKFSAGRSNDERSARLFVEWADR